MSSAFKLVLGSADSNGMQDSNLLTIDDVLFRGAKIVAFVVVCLALLAFLVPAELRGSNLLWGLGLAFAASAPIGMTFVGLAFREREARALGLMRLLDRQVEVVAGDLLANSDFTRDSLETAIRDLNSTGTRHLVWDRRSGLIQDGRLRQSRLHIETCQNCGVKISLDIALNEAASARCPACGSTIDAREVDQAKQSVVETLSHRADPPIACPPVPQRGFSLSFFVALLIFAWPLALVYAARNCTLPIEAGSI